MTACVDKKSKRVAAVVTASLVGALSIGAPAVALAANANIDMLIAGDKEDVKNGSITVATDQDDDAIADLSNIEFELKNGVNQFVKPVELTTKTGLTLKASDLTINYYVADKNGTSIINPGKDQVKVKWVSSDGSGCSAAGTYYVGVRAKSASEFDDNTFLKFSIVNKSLKGTRVIDGADLDDTTIEYTGAEQRLASAFNLALDDKVLSASTDYDAQLFVKGSATGLDKGVTDAGEYIVRVTGKGAYAGSVVDVPFTVEKLDLSTAEITINNQVAKAGVGAPTAVASVNGESSLGGLVKLVFKSADNGALAPSSAKGAYTYTVQEETADGKDNPSIEGTQDVVVVRYEKNVVFKYDKGTSFGSDASPLTDFDASKISVKDGKKDVAFKVSYLKKDGGKYVQCDASAITGRGEYKAVVTVDDATHTYGGSQEIFFKVEGNSIACSDIYATYKGDLVNGAAVNDIYSGEDLLPNLSFKVYDEDGKEVSLSEFDVRVTKDGKEVDKVVDKGAYKVSVETKKDSMYYVDGSDNVVTVTVDPVKIADSDGNAAIRLSGTTGVGTDGAKTYAYTGKAVVPTFEYDLTKAIHGYNKAEDWKALPVGSYKIAYKKLVKRGEKPAQDVWEDVDSAVKVGTYKAVLTDAAKDANHVVDTAVEFDVSDKKVFLDVPADEWFSKSVYAAKENGYIKGYNGTQLFGPNDMIKRGDVAIVLFNMAGGGQDGNVSSDMKLDFVSFGTKFSDVEADDYYAEAIGWAVKAGVVNGRPDGTFAPDEFVTRQDFACMLANYAEKTGVDVKSATSEVLEGLEGAGEVAGYAKDAVEWATASKLMGKDGRVRANDTISRAEVAAMAVDFQPNGADSSLL